MILVGADFVQQALDEPRRDPRTSHGYRAGDRRTQLVARHARHEVLPCVERLGQAGILHALADEVRPHRQHDIDGHYGLAAGLEQQLHERHGLVARGRHLPAPLESEELLELIDDDQDVVARRDVGLAHRVDQAALAAPERGIHQHTAGRGERALGDTDHLGYREGLRQVSERVLAWTHHHDAPAAAGLHHQPTVQRRDEAAPDERRLSASGRADDRQEPVEAKPAEQFVDLPLTSEEQVVFVGLERTQAGERVHERGCDAHVTDSRPLARSAARKGSSAAASQPFH